jgi:hypothetical protein
MDFFLRDSFEVSSGPQIEIYAVCAEAYKRGKAAIWR